MDLRKSIKTMNKIIFVTGIPGAGKSTFLRRKYFDRGQYFVMDMAEESLRKFGSLSPLKDEDYGEQRLSIINGFGDKGLFALFDGKDLVIEHNVVGEDWDEFFDLLQKAKRLGFYTEWIHLHVEDETAKQRIQMAGDGYYVSESLMYDVLMVLEGILEDYELNVQLEEIASIKGPRGIIQLFEKQSESVPVFFFTEEHSHYSGFKSAEIFQEEDAVKPMVLFNNLKEALEAIFDQYELKKVSILTVKDRFKAIVEETFNGKMDVPYWEEFLN
ncbi:hypothetical protein B879_03903 [Cecembia lonarensis LW9]|uniref:Uncharacterized protein n=2 Tax=Cecembia TaxID=1187078 RepID=K1LAQ9_CECL9|nr:hypothetical protein B879_03903 [Cecembia lonarensis LW9]